MDEIAYFPLDVRQLHKGQVIEVLEIERITGTPRRHAEYPLKVLWLRTKIEKELRKLGQTLTMRIHKGALVICDDSDAAKYNRRQGRLKIRAYRRAHKRNVAVDMSKLTADERRDHERTLVIQGTLLGAIHSAKRQLAGPTAQPRRTPALTDGTKQ